MNAQNIRDYNFTLAANATQNLDVPGDYLKVIAATGAIRVRTVEGWMKDLLPGQGVKGLNFQRLILEDRSGAANVGTIAVGIGADSIVDDRVTGSVEVIDTGKTLTANGKTFFGTRSQAASAGVFSFVQLWNPVGSGVRLSVRRLAIASDAAGTMPLFIGTVDINAGDTTKLANKLIGAAASTIMAKAQTDANATGAAGWSLSGVSTFAVVANTLFEVPLSDPLVLNAGRGVVVRGPAVNQLAQVFADVEEF
jgi:hypothetical protein